jgi:hypothetical protein
VCDADGDLRRGLANLALVLSLACGVHSLICTSRDTHIPVVRSADSVFEPPGAPECGGTRLRSFKRLFCLILIDVVFLSDCATRRSVFRRTHVT